MKAFDAFVENHWVLTAIGTFLVVVLALTFSDLIYAFAARIKRAPRFCAKCNTPLDKEKDK